MTRDTYVNVNGSAAGAFVGSFLPFLALLGMGDRPLQIFFGAIALIAALVFALTANKGFPYGRSEAWWEQFHKETW